MKRRIVEGGSGADGDGHVSYAARRRNLACRPSALGRLHGAHESLPTQRRLISLPTIPAAHADHPEASIAHSRASARPLTHAQTQA
jgi:hypothetical protein